MDCIALRGLSNTCKQIYSFQLKANPRTYTQSHTLTVVQGVDGTPA